jgi:hypothetical protein
VIIHQIDIMGVAVLKPENYTPVGADRDDPKAGKFPLQGMKPEAGQIHRAHVTGFIEAGQNTLDLVYLIGPEMAAFASLIEPFQPPMPKTSDHREL